MGQEEKMLMALMERCGAGTPKQEIVRVSGGLLHRMYRVETERGIYAVKHLNPEIMARPGVMENFCRAEQLERKLQQRKIPIVPALEFDGRKMQEISGEYFNIFRWLDGARTDPENINPEMCREVGRILGKIHAVESFRKEPPEDTGGTIDFSGYLQAAEGKDEALHKLLLENLTVLSEALEKLKQAEEALPPICCITDDDMDPKNVMWKEGAAYVIDLECLDYGNPAKSALILALQWCGTLSGDFQKARLQAFFEGYLSEYDNGFRSYDSLFGIAYDWVHWLEYNIKRALGLTGAAEEERALGMKEVVGTLRIIRYLYEKEPEICAALREMK